ncbi:MAG: ATP-binding cassette domain-containing protein [Chloroflexi bacterium]|nr:ATP-binding cassette domain-containing protein [Chloroflexota bacterium]
MTSSTPDALWSAAPTRLLRPAGIAWSGLRHGGLLTGATLSVPVGTRLLVVGVPEASASLLLRVLAGLSRPRAGRLEIAGVIDPSLDEWGRRAAYVGPHPGIHRWMTPREALRLAAELLGMSAEATRRRMLDVVEWTRIPATALDRPVGRGGPATAQRTALAAALLRDPEVLLLDEALRSIDPDERRRMLRVPGERRTVLVASRYPASEAGVVTHLALLRSGRVALAASLDELDTAGLPLSMRGIEELADRRGAAPRGEPARAAVADR